jgi:hypothetical protein
MDLKHAANVSKYIGSANLKACCLIFYLDTVNTVEYIGDNRCEILNIVRWFFGACASFCLLHSCPKTVDHFESG